MIKKVTAESTSYYYVTDPLHDKFQHKINNEYDNIFLNKPTEKIDNIRLIVDELHLTKIHYYYLYLFWVNPIDLEDLDKRIIEDRYSDSDFKYAIKCQYTRSERCPKCYTSYKALIMDVAYPYFGNKGLSNEKRQLVRSNGASIHCPNCNSYFRESPVLKIFGLADDSLF